MIVAPIIWVDGSIGAGKSEFVERLAKHLGYKQYQEPVASESLLNQFYLDPKRWAFMFQMHMLRQRKNLHHLATLETRCGKVNGIIFDRGMPGDAVFAKMHRKLGNMTEREFGIYNDFYTEYMTIPHIQPSLLLYLRTTPEVSLKRIQKRGRLSEQNIDLNYLQSLGGCYDNLLAGIRGDNHAWSRGMKMFEVDWNEDNLPIKPIAVAVSTLCREIVANTPMTSSV